MFLKDVGLPENQDLSLDRIDSNKSYEKNNCRGATKAVQSYNQRKSVRNKSGYIGISFCKQTGRWRATIKVDGNFICLGRYVDLKLAVEARHKAEMQYYGYIKGENS